jgi:histidinol-phosphate/aromatic aminotransferase/cobyric acid decarboxylase-like protein
VLQAVKKNNAKLMFFATPNNPTGNALTEQQIIHLCSQNPDCVVALDEAYIEFSDAPVVTSIPLIEKFPNLVIFRTFSKYSALAGLRVGFAVAHPELAGVFMALKQPYNMSSVADAAARACIKHMDKLLTQIDLIKYVNLDFSSILINNRQKNREGKHCGIVVQIYLAQASTIGDELYASRSNQQTRLVDQSQFAPSWCPRSSL